MNKQTTNVLIAAALISLVVCLRLLPHPANFAPVAAAAIFGGAVLPRRLALWVPLLAMVASDLLIGLHDLILLTWGCYALTALASSYLMKKPTIVRGASLALGASTMFFLVTNFGVWLSSGMYEHTWAGLARCFEMAPVLQEHRAQRPYLYRRIVRSLLLSSKSHPISFKSLPPNQES